MSRQWSQNIICIIGCFDPAPKLLKWVFGRWSRPAEWSLSCLVYIWRGHLLIICGQQQKRNEADCIHLHHNCPSNSGFIGWHLADQSVQFLTTWYPTKQIPIGKPLQDYQSPNHSPADIRPRGFQPLSCERQSALGFSLTTAARPPL